MARALAKPVGFRGFCYHRFFRPLEFQSFVITVRVISTVLRQVRPIRANSLAENLLLRTFDPKDAVSTLFGEKCSLKNFK